MRPIGLPEAKTLDLRSPRSPLLLLISWQQHALSLASSVTLHGRRALRLDICIAGQTAPGGNANRAA